MEDIILNSIRHVQVVMRALILVSKHNLTNTVNFLKLQWTSSGISYSSYFRYSVVKYIRIKILVLFEKNSSDE